MSVLCCAMYWNVTQLYFLCSLFLFCLFYFYFFSPPICLLLLFHDRPNHIFRDKSSSLLSLVWYLLKHRTLKWFVFMTCLYHQNTLIHKRAKKKKKRVCGAALLSRLHSEQAYSSTTLLCCKLYLTWKRLTWWTKDFYVQRPSVWLSAWVIMQREQNLTHTHTHIFTPLNGNTTIDVQTNADGIWDNFLRKWILQIFSGFLLCRLRSGRSGVSCGTRVSCSLRGGRRSLPPVYSF